MVVANLLTTHFISGNITGYLVDLIIETPPLPTSSALMEVSNKQNEVQKETNIDQEKL